MRTHALVWPHVASVQLIASNALPSIAQQDSIAQHRNDCRLAAQIITTGHPDPHRPWAFAEIGRCGSDGGVAIAEALRRLRDLSVTSHDSERLLNAARSFQDRTVYETALALADDQGATVFARVSALRVLLSLVDPTKGPSHEEMISEGHLFGSEFDPLIVRGEPLPQDYLVDLAASASALCVGTSVPGEVRNAARHLSSAALFQLSRK
jgi:hypothetical protein